ncbi:hypothetical protein [Burkholderia pseudomultivorans]|nr:hypothetical protein [Burkholderia pseudomultivorans]
MRSRDHNGTVNASLADSIPFVKRVLAGEKIRPVCTPAPQPSSASQ